MLAEIPVMAPVIIVTPLSSPNDTAAIRRKKPTNTRFNLLAEKLVDGTISFTIARISGGQHYLRLRNQRKLEGLSLGELEDFTGSVHYYTLEGDFIHGERYQDGRRVATIMHSRIIRPGTAEADSLCRADTLHVPERIRGAGLKSPGTRATEVVCDWVEYWVDEYNCWEVFVGEVSYGEECEWIGGHYESSYECWEVTVPDPDPVDPVEPEEPDPDEGGGGSEETPEEEPESKRPVELIDKSKFVGWHAGANCWELCRQIMQNYGQEPGSYEHVFQLLIEINSTKPHLAFWSEDPVQVYEQAIACIDRHLNNGKVIMVGVDYDIGKANSDGTDHFVVVTGRGYDSQKNLYYYTIMDCGTYDPEKGCDTEFNRLYYNQSLPSFEGYSAGTNDGRSLMSVTQVRPNDGDVKNTVKQYGK